MVNRYKRTHMRSLFCVCFYRLTFDISDVKVMYEQEGTHTMINDQAIKRINELYQKQKTVGLTKEELAEQQQLRKQYLAGIRTSLRGHLDNIRFVDKD